MEHTNHSALVLALRIVLKYDQRLQARSFTVVNRTVEEVEAHGNVTWAPTQAGKLGGGARDILTIKTNNF